MKPPGGRSSRLAIGVIWLICLLGLGAANSLAGGPAEPEGYRLSAYRAPTPPTLAGATVLSNQAAHDLWTNKAAIFIDVMPRPPKPENLPEGTLWRDKPRDNIPGSAWLANVGFGALSPKTETYFRDGLRQITAGDKSAALVIYCQADCWMSWNAAKRALSFGYQSVYWYPEGTDGWGAAGWPLEDSTPLPME